MKNLLKRFLARHSTGDRPAQPHRAAADPPPPPAPGSPLYIVGDIHGRADLLKRLLTAIDRDAAAHDLPGLQIVFIGDYIDRGEQSAQVLDLLRALTARNPARFICLMGNHEKMLLDFLTAPEHRGKSWLKYGGLQTLASFRIGGVSERATAQARIKAAADLRAAFPPGTEHWLRALPLKHANGNVICVHAAADPRLPLEQQSDANFLWGHPNFFTEPRQDGLWIAHGHSVVETARAADGIISIDTGAYFSNVLTAAFVAPNQPVRFLTS